MLTSWRRFQVLDASQQYAGIRYQIAPRLHQQLQVASGHFALQGGGKRLDVHRFFVSIAHAEATADVDVLQANAPLLQIVDQR